MSSEHTKGKLTYNRILTNIQANIYVNIDILYSTY
jgi:hypothetical protein